MDGGTIAFCVLPGTWCIYGGGRLKTTIYAKDDYAEKITVEYTPAEWIVERDALRRFVLDYGNCAKDRKIAIRMLEGNTVVTEITRMIDKK